MVVVRSSVILVITLVTTLIIFSNVISVTFLMLSSNNLVSNFSMVLEISSLIWGSLLLPVIPSRIVVVS
jgi:hypothetical protein